tara:strand:- start:4697 stop:5359 length:663 start_codon:yes stop_codon:yes gene_type:complete
MLIPPFTMLLALLPLIGYLILIGGIRASGRALITTGPRDVAAIGIAVSGLIAVGPVELFFPAPAASMFGPWVWFAIAAFYFLCLTLIAITSTPKLVIYGRSADQVFPALLTAARHLDPAATGDAAALRVVMPTIKVQLRIDGQSGADSAQIFAFEPNLTSQFWYQLQAHLRAEVPKQPVPRNLGGVSMLIAAGCLIGLLLWHSSGREELVVEGFRKWLWR